MPFYYEGILTTADIIFLQANTGFGTSNVDTKTRVAANLRYDIEKFTLRGKVLNGEDGSL